MLVRVFLHYGDVMNKVMCVVIRFLGDLICGFQIVLDISYQGEAPHVSVTGKLPANPYIIGFERIWSSTYQSRCGSVRIHATKSKSVNIAALNQELYDKSNDLRCLFNAWLKSDDFSRITNCLNKLDSSSEIRIIISSNCQELRKLPWHLWDALTKFSRAEVALSVPDAELGSRVKGEKARILIVLGDSTNINVEADKLLLMKYCSGAEIVLLNEPSRLELIHHLHDELGWDFLFYSGHSLTIGAVGQIWINKNDNLSIGDLKDALQFAIQKRLQLAIFNSCDGLGIASELEKLNISQVIVMRELIPDMVAQEFLKCFLIEFTSGNSLYISVKKARERLLLLEDTFPCASWLPVIVQHQLETSPTW